MYNDLGARTREAKEISEKSRSIVRKFAEGDAPEDRIRQRCVIATGDPAFADLMRFNNEPIRAGVKAILEKSQIFTDVTMAQAGITKLGHKCNIRCVLEGGDKISNKTGATRTSAGFRALGKELNGSIIVIGNAPSAALAVCELVEQGLHPGLIVATPVGFVNAAKSKEIVRTFNTPSITCTGTRGGTPVAVAVVNELVHIANEEK